MDEPKLFENVLFGKGDFETANKSSQRRDRKVWSAPEKKPTETTLMDLKLKKCCNIVIVNILMYHK